jgi:hypothetical protein
VEEKIGCTDLYQGIRPGLGKGAKPQFRERYKGFFSSALKNKETWRIRQHKCPQTEKNAREEL